MKRLLDGVLDGQGVSWAWEGIKASPAAYEYRNKMEFSFGDREKDGELMLGMHSRGSFYDVVSVEDCKLVDEDYRQILRVVQSYFRSCGAWSQLPRIPGEGIWQGTGGRKRTGKSGKWPGMAYL